MSWGHWSGDLVDPHEAYCADGCGRLAETERIAGLTSRGTEVVELVCHPCRAKTVSGLHTARRPECTRLRRFWRSMTRKKR